MQTMPLYRHLATLIEARNNCVKNDNPDWKWRHEESIHKLVKQYMPSGSGFDNGTTLDIAASNPERLLFQTAFHHMDEHGRYDGWTEHSVSVKPSLARAISLTIHGINRNEIKDQIHEAFHIALTQIVER